MNSIISNNCLSGFIHRYFNQQFTNPFIWAGIDIDNMIYLIENYDDINFDRITNFILGKNDKCSDFYNIVIDDKIKVQFSHYHESMKDIEVKIKDMDVYYKNIKDFIKEKYFKRIARMKMNEVVFVIDGNYYSPQLSNKYRNIKKYDNSKLKRLLGVKSKYNIIIFTPDKEIQKLNKNEKITIIDCDNEKWCQGEGPCYLITKDNMDKLEKIVKQFNG